MKARILKVQDVGDHYRGKTKPVITLSGKWLADAGFEPNAKVRVIVENKKLYIIPEDDNAQIHE